MKIWRLRTFLLVGTLVLCSHLICQEQKALDHSNFHFESTISGGAKVSLTLKRLQNQIMESEKYAKSKVNTLEESRKASFATDRIVLSDICMGGDQSEHDQLGEGALVCFLGISKNPSELPFAKVYIESKNLKCADLILIAILPSEEVHKLRTDGSVGHNIWAGIYWIPSARSLEGQTFVDFSTTRTRFRTGVDFPLTKTISPGLVDKNPKSITVNFALMKKIIEREYPGFEITQGILEIIQNVSK